MNLSLAVSKDEMAGHADTLAATGHVRIEPALRPAAAEALHTHLANEVEWWRIVNQGDRIWDLGPESIAALTGDKERAFLDNAYAGARNGFQYIYDSVRVSENPAERQARGLLVDRLVDSLNSPASLDLFRTLTGCEDIALVDGQATRYLAGHFLTEHDDGVAVKKRVAAYVLNLTPHWRTAWGGLLQFHDARGDVTRALAPGFNAINVFRVPCLHSVSLVAPFAGAPRYSVTGWLRRG